MGHTQILGLLQTLALEWVNLGRVPVKKRRYAMVHALKTIEKVSFPKLMLNDA
jgi:hypothetical protein